MITVRIFEILFPIFAIVLVGLVYGRFFRPDMTVPNRLNMAIFIPCLLFNVLIDRSQEVSLFGQFAAACTIVILLSGSVTWLLARQLKISARTLCPPMMFSNAGNLGLPLMVLTFGNEALAVAVVMFVVCNFFHITLGSYILNREANLFTLLLSPMIVAVLFALILSYSGISVDKVIMEPIKMLGQICVPLMLFTLGVRLLDTDFTEWRLGMIVAVLSPIIGVTLVLLISPLFELTKIQQGVLFLFGALPPAVMNYMFAEHYDQEPSRVAAMVLFGNLVSVITLPLALFYVLPKFT